MTDTPPFFHSGARALQDEFDSRRLADRIEATRVRRELTDGDRELLESCRLFFLATADAAGRPDCSYKGGDPGLLRVLGSSEIAFPSYDGNGMFRSLGNISVNPSVGLLVIDFERQRRLRLNGEATIDRDPELLRLWPEAQLAVRVRLRDVFPNCPRYIHRMSLVEPSPYVPRREEPTPRPAWKDMEELRDALPERDRRPSDS